MTQTLTRAISTRTAAKTITPLALLVALLLSACTSTPPQTPPTPAPSSPQASSPEVSAPASVPAPEPVPESPHPPTSWRLDQGLLVIHVGKTGRLARLGHNHLVSSTKLTGEGAIDAQGQLIARVSLDVSDLEVDDPTLRASYRQRDDGNSPWATAYASSPSEKNIADTRANMLGKRVLDVQQHPKIEVVARAQNAGDALELAESGRLSAQLTISIKSTTAVLPATLTWQRRTKSTISWQSSFKTTHEALGLTPFSALGGALAVAEPLQFDVSGVLEYSGTVQITTPSVGRR